MAEDTGQTKTEVPTPRRRAEARKKGQLAVSTDLSAGLLLLAGVGVLWLFGSSLSQKLHERMRFDLLRIHQPELDTQQTSNLLAVLLENTLNVTGVLVALLFLVALGTGSLQAGFNFTLEPLTPDWSRISPAKGWSRLFSLRSAMRGVMSLAKLAAILLIVWWILKGRIGQIAFANHGSLDSAAQRAWEITIHTSLAVAAALVLIGLSDYAFQRWRHEGELKMSRQDIKEELKQDEGDPLMRARIKKLQREVAQRHMIQDVPNATVVLRNPMHIAVALQYDRHTMSAPKVIAKGSNLLARRIVKVATEHGIPVLERKPLARVLYAAVDVGQEIPAELYQAIAGILAYIYRLRRTA